MSTENNQQHIYSSAAIHFRYCASIDNYNFPMDNKLNALIIDGNRSNFINDAVSACIKSHIDKITTTPVSCTDENNFQDCQAVGKIIGVVFAFQVNCDE